MNEILDGSRRISILLPDLRGGGAERVCINLANEFVRRGLAVDMVLMGAEGELLPILDTRILVVDLRAARLRNVLVPLISYLRRARPAGLVANMWPLTVIAPLARMLSRVKTRVVGVEHTTWSVSERASDKGYMLRLRFSTWLGYRLANGIVAVSSGAADEVAALAGLSRDCVVVIHNPIAGLAGERASLRVEPATVKWTTGPHKRVLAVGTLKAIKDYPTLIEAFAVLRQTVEAKLLILGEGEERPRLARLAKSLGLERDILMPGFVDYTTPYYACADLHVLSSKGEGLPTVIVEALEQGTPVVSTDCPSGPREILADGRYGTLVPVGDPDALATAMLESLRSTHDHDALRARAQDFSVDKAADAYLDLLLPDWRNTLKFGARDARSAG